MDCPHCKEKNEIISELRFRLFRPHDAFLRDAEKKDNCKNCTNYKGQCSSPNSDRVNCDFAEGWPHWTTKCKNWQKRMEVNNGKNKSSSTEDIFHAN